jgi:hypothetical protein
MSIELRIYFLYSNLGEWNDTLSLKILPLIDSRAQVFNIDSEEYQKMIYESENKDAYSLRFSKLSEGGYPKLVMTGEHYSTSGFKSDFDKLVKQKNDINGFATIINNKLEKLLKEGSIVNEEEE